MLSIVMLFQGCASAYTGSYTLPEAMKANRKVQITTTANEKIVYQKVDTLQGKWVGIKSMDQPQIYEKINPQTITKIQLGPTAGDEARQGRTVLMIIGGVVLAIGLIYAAVSNVNVFGGQ